MDEEIKSILKRFFGEGFVLGVKLAGDKHVGLDDLSPSEITQRVDNRFETLLKEIADEE